MTEGDTLLADGFSHVANVQHIKFGIMRVWSGRTKFHPIQNHECKHSSIKISHAWEAPASLEPHSTHEGVGEASTAQAGPVPGSC